MTRPSRMVRHILGTNDRLLTDQGLMPAVPPTSEASTQLPGGSGVLSACVRWGNGSGYYQSPAGDCSVPHKVISDQDLIRIYSWLH